MNKLGKKLVAAGICICMAAASLTGCGNVNADAAVATLDGEKVPFKIANFMLRYNQAQMQSSYGSMFGEDMWNTDLMGSGTPYGTTFKTQIMDSLEEMLILEKHMADYDITVTDDEKAKIESSAKQFMEENSQETIDELTASQETVSRVLTLYTINNKMKKAIEAEADTNVSDDEAAQKTVSYVLFSTADTTDADGNTKALTDDEKKALKDNAQKVLDAVKGGKEMDAAVKEIDEEKSASTSSYGTDNGTLPDEVKTAADKLKDGETADSVVETDSGYYVVQMKSTFDKEATETQKETIINQRKSDKYEEVYTAWKEKVEFKVDDKVWGKITFTDKVTVKQTETEAQSNATEAGSEGTTDTAASENTTEAVSEKATEAGSEAAATEAGSEAATTEATTTEAATQAATTEAVE